MGSKGNHVIPSYGIHVTRLGYCMGIMGPDGKSNACGRGCVIAPITRYQTYQGKWKRQKTYGVQQYVIEQSEKFEDLPSCA